MLEVVQALEGVGGTGGGVQFVLLRHGRKMQMSLFRRVWPFTSILSPREHSWVISKPYRKIENAEEIKAGDACSNIPLASAPRSIPGVTK
jgi:hypothetical protein